METDEANQELTEYEKFDKFEKNKELFLEKPHKCQPEKSKELMEAIDKCKNKTNFKNKLMENELSLLVIEDGGENLLNYADKSIKRQSSYGGLFHFKCSSV
jgi:hypothetical protein